MKIAHVVMLVIFAAGMGLGQLLLKFSAIRQPTDIDQKWYSLLSDWPFILGVVLYGILLIYWRWLLTFLPLSRAYPFTFLSLVVASVGSSIFFGEPLTPQLWVGLAIVGIGLVVLSAGLQGV